MIAFIITLLIFLRTLLQMLKEQEFKNLFVLTAITLAFGTVVYHNLEGWRWLDSLYFSVITLATIGYGDFTPVTDAGKIFTIVYVFLGLGILVGFVTSTGEYLQKRRHERVESRSGLAFWSHPPGNKDGVGSNDATNEQENERHQKSDQKE